MTKKRILFFIFLLFILASCETKEKLFEKMDGGIILRAEVVPTSFNECLKMQIITDKYFFILRTHVFVPIGERITIYVFQDGGKRISWPSSDFRHRIY